MITSPQKFDFEKDEKRKKMYRDLKIKEAQALEKEIKQTKDIKKLIIFKLRLANIDKDLDRNNKFDLIQDRIKWCENYIHLKQQLYDYNLKKLDSVSELEKTEILLENMEIESDIEAKMNWVARYKQHIERTTNLKKQ